MTFTGNRPRAHDERWKSSPSMTYPGGKNADGVFQAIINQIPPHSVYIEPFLGSGAIARLKRPAELTIGVDMDRRAIDKFFHWTERHRLGVYKWSREGLQLIVGDALAFLRYFPWARHPDSFVYLDPPYPVESRRDPRRIYEHEDSPEFQARFLALVPTLPARVAVSGYENPLYREAFKDWRSISYTAVTRGGKAAKEFLWMNYPVPKTLHDSRYTGDRWQLRQMDRKMQRRWIEKLRALEPSRRRALIDRINAENFP